MNAQEISPQRLFEVLQQEYLICILRAQIYPFQQHKDYWIKVSEEKKKKIFNLKQKSRSPVISIFDDSRVYDDYKKKTYNDFGLPNFYYPSENNKQKQQYWDVKNYFANGYEVKFLDKDYNLKKGKIVSLDVDKRLVHIEFDKKEDIILVEFNNVSRIL